MGDGFGKYTKVVDERGNPWGNWVDVTPSFPWACETPWHQTIYTTKAPNAFHRLMHRLFFGIKWHRTGKVYGYPKGNPNG